MLKLGLGLYKSLLNSQNFQFAKQTGASHLVVQLVDYMSGGSNPNLANNHLNGWGKTNNQEKFWEFEDLLALKKEINAHGLEWDTIENFDPAHWYDILLDGPEKEKQLDNLKYMLKNMGKAGIRNMGYYFSLAGVWGWTSKNYGRGNPMTVGYDASAIDSNAPIPNGMVWNMTYNENASPGVIDYVPREEMWDRLTWFLENILPVAEENNIRMLAHPDDPPMPELRNTGRLFYTQDYYEKLLEISDSPSNGFECCLGTIQEMKGSNVLDFVDKQSRDNKIGYVHFRNVKGKVPNYREVFVDEGDIDMPEVIRILKRNNYDGILIPDHSPAMSCDAPWHASMAYSMGYMKALIENVS
ncbi:mannonate dehydratase [Portibacter lacus]|uniref:mannonate dehydratase n=1 Tax=Portibacter lacus TaxID=1099794 RepID=A0AA37SQ29_9BACT|nr:mannonate dehydratase [Portibacter lacus]GLR18728.1 mannonate dehydratase [Portibacter lacus]